MRISRRGLLTLAAPLMAASLSEAAQTEYESLDYREGRLHWSRGSAAAAVGRAGVKADKREGDGSTPAGTYSLVSVLYREDDIAPAAAPFGTKRRMGR
jgi:L,D-peptidoglycan transpeptidase YkuD (ErfK/YbiS/YcfS/YnhG family)